MKNVNRKMKNIFYILFVSTILFSCETKKEKLQFSAFEIKNENTVNGITINDNGEININGQNIGIVYHNGILNNKNGNILAKITDDNFLQDKNGKNLIKIDEYGKMDNGSGLILEWTENGEFLKGTKKTGMSILPVDPKSFRTASAVLYLYLKFE